jgi:murein DD-endopeptidase MepM/ murein hydrolase activator NlpD
MKLIRHSVWIGIILVLCGLSLAAALSSPAWAAPQQQPTPFPTPTPGPDGRIIYIVQDGDTLFRISAISGVSVDEIRALNNLGADDIIAIGQQLLLGLAGPALPTQAPAQEQVTPSPSPSPTPGISSGTLCILLFNDTNGDALRQEIEPPIAGGAISISDRESQTSLTAETSAALDEDGLPVSECFQELPIGDYNITIAAPEGYNPTTLMNYALRIEGGDETYLDFGAQPNSEALAETPVTENPVGGSNAPLFGILGLLLVGAGIGLAIYALRLRQ